MWCRLLKVHIIPSKSPLHFSEVWITWPPFLNQYLSQSAFFSVRFGRFLGWTCIKQSIMCIAQRQNTEPQKRLGPETHLCWAEHITTERLSFSKITSIVRTKQMNRLVYTKQFSTPEDSCAFWIKSRCIPSIRESSVNLNKSRSGLLYFWIMSNVLQGRVSLKSSSLRTSLPEYLIDL